MAGRRPTEEVVNARIALAKARLEVLAAEADAGPNAAERAFGLVRRRPWQGAGLALIAGVVLGVGRGRALRTLVPVVAPVLAQIAVTALRGVDASTVTRASRAGTTSGARSRERNRP